MNVQTVTASWLILGISYPSQASGLETDAADVPAVTVLTRPSKLSNTSLLRFPITLPGIHDESNFGLAKTDLQAIKKSGSSTVVRQNTDDAFLLRKSYDNNFSQHRLRQTGGDAEQEVSPAVKQFVGLIFNLAKNTRTLRVIPTMDSEQHQHKQRA